jgi:hypothetical protein
MNFRLLRRVCPTGAAYLTIAVCLTVFVACGGGAGHGADADGPLPNGQHRERGLVLVEEGEEDAKDSEPGAKGDGTTTTEIVESVERDQP